MTDEEKKKKKKKKKDKGEKSESKSESKSLIRSMTDDTGRVFQMATKVRVSFPALHEFPTIKGELQDKGSCRIVLDKEDSRDMALRDEWLAIAEEIRVKDMKSKDISESNLFIRDGKFLDTPMPGFWVVSCNCSKGTLPLVIDVDGKSIVKTAQDCRIYSGCYVNLKTTAWGQIARSRVNNQLISIQFHSDGEALTKNHVSADVAAGGFDQVEVEDREDLVG